MTPQQFDACTLEERELILDRRARMEREKAISHPLALANAIRGEDSRTLWIAQARKLVEDDPERIFNLQSLASDVFKWGESRNLKKDNGAPYAERTVYNCLKENRVELVLGKVSADSGVAP